MVKAIYDYTSRALSSYKILLRQWIAEAEIKEREGITIPAIPRVKKLVLQFDNSIKIKLGRYFQKACRCTSESGETSDTSSVVSGCLEVRTSVEQKPQRPYNQQLSKTGQHMFAQPKEIKIAVKHNQVGVKEAPEMLVNRRNQDSLQNKTLSRNQCTEGKTEPFSIMKTQPPLTSTPWENKSKDKWKPSTSWDYGRARALNDPVSSGINHSPAFPEVYNNCDSSSETEPMFGRYRDRMGGQEWGRKGIQRAYEQGHLEGRLQANFATTYET